MGLVDIRVIGMAEQNVWNLMATQKLKGESPEKNLKAETEDTTLFWFELAKYSGFPKNIPEDKRLCIFSSCRQDWEQTGLDCWKNWLEKKSLTSC